VSLENQFLTLLIMVCSGASLGVLFDTYRAFIIELRVPRGLLPPMDLLYWILAAFLTFGILFLSNGGEIRFYVFVAIGMGMVFYFTLLSRVILRMFRAGIRLFKQMLLFFMRLLQILLVQPLTALVHFFVKLSIFIYKIVLQCLYPFWRIMLWVLRRLSRR
jgi:spore cortex biosynthesis protein YabQ